MAERLGVVLAQALDVQRLDARPLERERHARDVQRRRVREHVALGERPRLGLAVAQAGDAVVEQPAARLQQARELARVEVDLVGADVLDHPDRGDRVVALAGRAEIAVVRDADLHPVLEAGLGHAPARQLGLGGGERDADRLDPVVGGRVDHEAAPAAADVEHALALPQRELPADQLALGRLRLLERRAGVAAAGGGWVPHEPSSESSVRENSAQL